MNNKYILTLDIGGTNPRIAIIKIIAKNQFKIIQKEEVDKNQISIIPSINNFLKKIADKNITTNICCISIAGPIENNCCINPPNAKFSINDKEILKNTMLKNVFVVNDFEAIGNALTLINIEKNLQNKKIIEIKSGNINKKGNRGLIGPGSGLGVAYLINKNYNFIVSASEGGHSSIQELEETPNLIKFLRKKYNYSQIGTEVLVSGQGIKNLFEYLSIENPDNEDRNILNVLEDKNVDIAKLIAISNTINAKKAMNLFLKYLALASQDVALQGFTTGGIFIGGGICSKNLNLFENEIFKKYFINNWKQKELLKKIPVYIIIDYDISFYGCAKIITDKFK